MALVAATVVLGLPQVASATVYDKQLYDQIVADGTSPEQARCVSALEGARVSLERYVDGYFVAVSFEDAEIAPNTNPQHTDEDGNFSWEVGDGEYRVSVIKTGYWRSFSGIVTGPGAVLDEHVALKRRPGTMPPQPRDCGDVTEPEPAPEPEPEAEVATATDVPDGAALSAAATAAASDEPVAQEAPATEKAEPEREPEPEPEPEPEKKPEAEAEEKPEAPKPAPSGDAHQPKTDADIHGAGSLFDL